MKSVFLDPIVLEDAGMRGDSRLFKLVGQFRVKTSKGTFTVPAGFVTDGASIPRIFWNILSPFGPYFGAAIFHDYGYSKDCEWNLSREEVDELFKELMFNSGIGWLKRETIYRAVRTFGGFSFKR